MSAPLTSPQPSPTRRLGLILPIVLMVLSALGIAATAIYAGHQASLTNQPGFNYSGQFPGQGGNQPGAMPTAFPTDAINPAGQATSGGGTASGGQTAQRPTGGANNSGYANFGNGQFPGGRVNRGADTTPVSVWGAVIIGVCAAIFGASAAFFVIGLRRPRPVVPVMPPAQPVVTPSQPAAPTPPAEPAPPAGQPVAPADLSATPPAEPGNGTTE